jgi:Rod binding domain-containing protein
MTLAPTNSELPPLSNRPQVASVSSQAESSAHKKLRKAAQDFEGILISQLLGEFNMGFSSLAGDAPLAGSETLNSLEIQTLSGAMAGRGGFGIGQMLVHQLEPSLNRGEQNQEGGKIKTASQG